MLNPVVFLALSALWILQLILKDVAVVQCECSKCLGHILALNISETTKDIKTSIKFNVINYILLKWHNFDLIVVSGIFILLSRESDQCAIQARLGVASHLSTTPRWGNSIKCLSQISLPACFPHCPFNAERRAGKLRIPILRSLV